MERSDLKVIDMDLIAELRMQGKGLEAREILKAYHKNKKKEKEQLKREIRRNENLKKRIKIENGRKKKN